MMGSKVFYRIAGLAVVGLLVGASASEASAQSPSVPGLGRLQAQAQSNSGSSGTAVIPGLAAVGPVNLFLPYPAPVVVGNPYGGPPTVYYPGYPYYGGYPSNRVAPVFPYGYTDPRQSVVAPGPLMWSIRRSAGRR